MLEKMQKASIAASVISAGLALVAWVMSTGVFDYSDSGFADRSSRFKIPAIALTLVALYLWTLVFMRVRWDSVTRCRKCKMILSGLSDPRCPECGERI